MKMMKRAFLYIFFVTVLFFNICASLQFDSQDAIFFLENNNSDISMTSTVYGWIDGSIRRKLDVFGHYNLFSLDTNNDKKISYLESQPDQFVYSDFFIPQGSIIHVDTNTVYDLGGRFIQIDDDAQLFIDSNVTVTIRNATIKYTRSSLSFPPIRLASVGSKLALDNVSIQLSQDFHFPQGQLFVHNNVNMVGNAAFVYKAPQTGLFIASQSKLYFDTGSTFSVAPSAFTDAPYTLKNTYTDCRFIRMADQSSQLYLNGCSFFTTHTGCRLMKGSVFFDGSVPVNTMTDHFLTSEGIGTGINIGHFTTTLIAWHPSGKFIVLDGTIYAFNGVAFSAVCAGGGVWSPDGKYLAMAGSAGFPGTSTVVSFDGVSLGPVIPVNKSPLISRVVAWNPDGKYLALGNSYGPCYVYPFNGTSFDKEIMVDALHINNDVRAIAWSPDGKYLAVGTMNGGVDACYVYPFDGVSFGTGIPIDMDYSATANSWSMVWSPDGRYLATPQYVYSFDGVSFGPRIRISVPHQNGYFLAWSPDGKYLAQANWSDGARIYSFNGDSFNVLTTITYPSNTISSVDWHPDGSFIALGGFYCSSFAYPITYAADHNPSGLHNGLIFGDSAKGADYDVNLNFLSNAQIQVQQGTVTYDCVH
jgi:WD40 repeat protein